MATITYSSWYCSWQTFVLDLQMTAIIIAVTIIIIIIDIFKYHFIT